MIDNLPGNHMGKLFLLIVLLCGLFAFKLHQAIDREYKACLAQHGHWVFKYYQPVTQVVHSSQSIIILQQQIPIYGCDKKP